MTDFSGSSPSGRRSPVVPVLHGLIVSLCIALAGVLLIASALAWTSLSEAGLPYLIYTVHAAAVLAGAGWAARKAGHRGWYYGLFTGFGYALTVTILALASAEVSLTPAALIQGAILVIIGSFGGVIGVNLARER